MSGSAAEEDPAAALERYARELAEGIESATPRWVEGSVARIMIAWSGSVPAPVAAAASDAGRRAGAEVTTGVRDLLLRDVDEQRTTPLSLIRAAVRYPTEVLRAAGVPPVERDEFAERSFPDDIYGLSPSSLADLDPALAELGIAWGAAKAFEHRRRHAGGAAGRNGPSPRRP